MDFSPGPDFYAAAAQVIPLLLLALVFEARVLTRLRAVLPIAPKVVIENPPGAEGDDEPETREGLRREFERQIEVYVSEMQREFEIRFGRLRRRVVVLLLLGIAVALGAEAVALVALVLSDPSDALAWLVLAGCGILIAALLVTLGDAAVQETRRTPPTEG